MATYTFNAAADNSTDANFRAWGSGVSAGFAALGLIQTADTGQINWTTVTHPTLSNTSQGYEIWRFNDSLQSTSPVYFKIEYGSSGIANDCSFWLTTGTGSNGSGSIINPSTRNQFGVQVNSLVITTSYMAGDSGGFAMMFMGGTSVQNLPVFLVMERSKSVTGADTGTFVSVGYAAQVGTNSSPFFYIQICATGVVNAEPSGQSIPGLYTKITNTQASGNIALVPIMPCYGFFQYPLRRVISGIAGDWTNGDAPSISLYPGITDAYLCFKISTSSTSNCTWIFGPNGGNNANYCILMRNQ